MHVFYGLDRVRAFETLHFRFNQAILAMVDSTQTAHDRHKERARMNDTTKEPAAVERLQRYLASHGGASPWFEGRCTHPRLELMDDGRYVCQDSDCGQWFSATPVDFKPRP